MVNDRFLLLSVTVLSLFVCILGNGIWHSVTLASDPPLTLYVDPPEGHSSPAALGVFVRASDPDAIIYYDENGYAPTFSSPKLTYNTPYVQLDTPFKASRNRTIQFIAVLRTPSLEEDVADTITRSENVTRHFFVEGSARANSYGFLVPGIESGGYFVRFGLEMAATARAQVAGGQEFADFTTNLGIGTYQKQIQALNLVALDPDLTGFEGGFPVNITYSISKTPYQYGILIPFHNGNEFFGKVVRVNLQAMANVSLCLESFWFESYVPVLNSHGVQTGTKLQRTHSNMTHPRDACVMVIDLKSKYPQAVGFRKGFMEYPYGYLSAGHYSTVARLNLQNFGLASTRLVDLGTIDSTYGGYSGGFKDGSWGCFNPYLTFAGPIGGVRSRLAVDANHLRPYFYATMLCINDTAWDIPGNETALITQNIRTIDFSSIEDTLRGFSEAIRVGRYAYIAPLQSADGVYTSKLIRIDLGEIDIGTTLTELNTTGTNVRTIIDILDLSKKSTALAGFSGMFTSGKYLFLVPFRNAYEPSFGQRGHGTLCRLNMNDYSLNGIVYLDMPSTTRSQVPSFADFKLRGYSAGFASGDYGVLVPFFNADFHGIVARVKTMGNTSIGDNLQELNLMQDRTHTNVFRGYRGGFVSLWTGVDESDL